MNELIQQLADTVGVAANEIVGHYVRWFIVSSVAWIVAALALVGYAFKADFSHFDNYDRPAVVFWFRMVAIILASATIAMNVSDLLAPHGIAIHQLLTDIRG